MPIYLLLFFLLKRGGDKQALVAMTFLIISFHGASEEGANPKVRRLKK